jgi:DNA-binding response OmpR family regulator
MKRILLIEDDTALAESLTKYLTSHSFEVKVAANLQKAEQAMIWEPSLIILDWMLPDGDGIDFIREVRKANNPIPVVFLTARAELVDRVLGLEAGANDYVTKPFEPRELVARIRARLRDHSSKLGSGEELSETKVGPFRISPKSHEAWFHETKLDLTRIEFSLLALMVNHPNRVFTREELLNKVWGFNQAPTTRTVDTHILMLRGKTHEAFFETIRGIGYKFVNEGESLQ